MADLKPEPSPAQGSIGDRLVIALDGIHLDGHKLPTTDQVTIEHVAPDFHIVNLTLYVKDVDVAEHHRVSKTAATAYRYVHDATDEEK